MLIYFENYKNLFREELQHLEFFSGSFNVWISYSLSILFPNYFITNIDQNFYNWRDWYTVDHEFLSLDFIKENKLIETPWFFEKKKFEMILRIHKIFMIKWVNFYDRDLLEWPCSDFEVDLSSTNFELKWKNFNWYKPKVKKIF